jgi:Bacteriophage baseplate protein W
MEAARAYLGVGWQFPVRVGANGGLVYSRAEQDVQEAIWLVLSTARGEREMLPDFGCGMHDYVFAPKNADTITGVAHAVREALTRWEPRIDVVDVRVDPGLTGDDPLLVRVDYRVRSNNAFQNLVYPFYVTEGPRS